MRKLQIDLGRPWELVIDGQTVPLRPAEWTMVRSLVEHVGQLVTWEGLYSALWSHERLVEPGQMYSHASRLRSKLRAALDEEPDFLRTVPKRGLCLDLAPGEVTIVGGVPRPKPPRALARSPRRSPAASYGRKSY
jgi:DNA-binding winged helix-turn-helix (wHTH) protein